MSSAQLRAGARQLDLGGRPWLMGIVNASRDSFSDGGRYTDLAQRLELARELVAQGADILDVGGESASTNSAAVSAQEEIERVVPLIEGIVGEPGWASRPAADGGERESSTAASGVLISVDTYKPQVARAAIAAGASIVNDVSGLRDPELAAVCAQSGAALVLMHTRAAPKERLQDPDLYGDIVGEVLDFLHERIALALRMGCAREQLIVDPGPDFAKTPAQTIALLRDLERLHELERPLLLAASRKDFIGALTRRPPRERLGGTLAAVGHGVEAGAQILRVHDVGATADYLRVRMALAGELEPERDLALAEEHRYERRPR